jgi:type I restriction enzyme, S subunit
MSEWETSTLGDVCHTFRSGGTPTSGWREYYGGAIPFVTIEDMTACNKHLSSTRKTITDAGLSASAAWLVPSQHLLYSMYATLGKTRINTLPVATNQAVAAILPDPLRLDLSYLYYALSNLEQQVHRFTSQTTQANLNAGIVKSFDIGHPSSIPEQRKIARILTTVDNLIEQTEALIEKYKSIKQGMMHDLFTRGVDQSGQLRPPYEDAPELYKESELGWIPKEWEVRGIGQHVTDWAVGPRFPGELYNAGGNVATLRTTDMDDEGNLSLSTMPNAQLNEREFQSHFLQPGDLVISRSGTCGITAIFPGYDMHVVPGAFLIRFRFTDDLFPPFLKRYFNASGGRHKLLLQAEGGVLKNIRGTSILKITVAFPSRPEQEEIEDRIRSCDKAIVKEAEFVDIIRATKTGLMHDLLTGKVRVNVDEVEEVTANV